jgi:hypothetical protein
MPVRETSIEVYRQIKEEGLLSKKRWEVYQVLFEIGPATGAEVNRELRKRKWISSVSEVVRNRITELYNMELVKETRKVICPVTGRNVIQWDVTSKHPVKKKKKRIVKVDADLFAEDLFSSIFMGPMHLMRDRLDQVFQKHLKISLNYFFKNKTSKGQPSKDEKQLQLDL